MSSIGQDFDIIYSKMKVFHPCTMKRIHKHKLLPGNVSGMAESSFGIELQPGEGDRRFLRIHQPSPNGDEVC